MDVNGRSVTTYVWIDDCTSDFTQTNRVELGTYSYLIIFPFFNRFSAALSLLKSGARNTAFFGSLTSKDALNSGELIYLSSRSCISLAASAILYEESN